MSKITNKNQNSNDWSNGVGWSLGQRPPLPNHQLLHFSHFQNQQSINTQNKTWKPKSIQLYSFPRKRCSKCQKEKDPGNAEVGNIRNMLANLQYKWQKNNNNLPLFSELQCEKFWNECALIIVNLALIYLKSKVKKAIVVFYLKFLLEEEEDGRE